jgi:putative two-component system response regulator
MADVYDALTSKRVYKSAFCHHNAKSIILKEAGAHFDPDIVAAFIAMEDRFVSVPNQFFEPLAEAA